MITMVPYLSPNFSYSSTDHFRFFSIHLSNYETRMFLGPPENAKDAIMYASVNLRVYNNK